MPLAIQLPARSTVTRGDASLRPAAPPAEPSDYTQHRAVERWVARRLGAVDHERRVEEIATRLFHLTRPLHRLGPDDLRLLRLAAVVHDVGRAVCDDTHPDEGARMVLADAYLPLTPTDRRHLAYLTLYHRGTVPAAGRDAVLGRADDADRLRRVLALLRAADALDSRSLQSPRLVFALVAPRPTARNGAGRRDRRLRVTCYLHEDCAKARRVYRRRKKFRLLEELLGCRVEIDIALAEALEMVA